MGCVDVIVQRQYPLQVRNGMQFLPHRFFEELISKTPGLEFNHVEF